MRDVAFVALSILALTGCKTTADIAEPMGKFFNGALSSPGIVSMTEFASHVPDPADAIVMVYNHGTDWGGLHQECEPDSMPGFLKRWANLGVAGRDAVVFYLCTQEYENHAAMGKSRSIENEAVLERLAAAGVPRRNIFLIGHSGGASAVLMTGARAPGAFNSVIASGPGYGFAWLEAQGEDSPYLDAEYSKWKTALTSPSDLSAYVLLYEGDIYSPPGDAAFLAQYEGAIVEVVRDDDGDGRLCRNDPEPHFFWWSRCFSRDYRGGLEGYVVDRLENRDWPD